MKLLATIGFMVISMTAFSQSANYYQPTNSDTIPIRYLLNNAVRYSYMNDLSLTSKVRQYVDSVLAAGIGGIGSNADSLNSQPANYYLDYQHLSNTPDLSGYATISSLNSYLLKSDTAAMLAPYSLLSHTHTFASLTSKPTTLAGYGITDAYPLTGNPSGFITAETDASALKIANNLSDLANAATARSNLGLGNVDNTSDANKPVSTAQQTALNLKLNIADTSYLHNQIAANKTAITARQKIARPFLIAAIGDSRLANSLNLVSTVNPVQLNWSNQGILTWFMFLTNQKYDLPYTYDLAVSGYTTAQILATVPSVLAFSPLPSFCIVNGGTNSISANVSLASIQSDFQNIASQLIAGGVRPVFITDAPRTVASWTSNQNKVHHALNNWLRKWCRDNGYALADAEAIITTQSTGEPAYNVSDGIHQNITGAYYQGSALATVFNNIAPTSADTRMQSVYDVYDATYNSYGNLLGSIGLLQGTSGTNTGTGASGTVATGWNNRIISGTATSVASKENPRTDGYMGDRQILTISSVSATTVIRYSPAASISPGSTTYQAGDTLIAEADIEVSAGSSLVDFVQLNFFETNSSSTSLATSIAFKGNTSSAYPMPTASYTGRVRTIPFVSQATTNSLFLRVEIQVETGGSATVKIGNVTIRKVHAGDGTIM